MEKVFSKLSQRKSYEFNKTTCTSHRLRQIPFQIWSEILFLLILFQKQYIYLYNNRIRYLLRSKYKMTKRYLSIMSNVNRVLRPLRYRDNTRASWCSLNGNIRQVIHIYKADRFFNCTIHQTNNRIYDGIQRNETNIGK